MEDAKGLVFLFLAVIGDKNPNGLSNMVKFLPAAVSAQTSTSLLFLTSMSLVEMLSRGSEILPKPGQVHSNPTSPVSILYGSMKEYAHVAAATILARSIFRDIFHSRSQFQRAFEDMRIDIASSPIGKYKSSIGQMSIYEWIQSAIVPYAPYVNTLSNGYTTFSISKGKPTLKVIRGITYHRPDDKIQLLMDVLIDPTYKYDLENPKIVLYVHGGGWITGFRQFQSVPLQICLANAGYIVCTIDYRLCPTVTLVEQIKDVKKALLFVKNRLRVDEIGLKAPTPGSKPRKVAITGESAGAHLSLMVSLTQNQPEWQDDIKGTEQETDTSVVACIDIYAPHDMSDREESFYRLDKGGMRKFIGKMVVQKKHGKENEYFEQVSPLALIESETSWCNKVNPPLIFGVHGTHDALVPVEDARMFYNRLRIARKRWNSPLRDGYCELDGAHHAFNMLLGPNTFALNDAALVFFDHCFNKLQNENAATTTAKL